MIDRHGGGGGSSRGSGGRLIIIIRWYVSLAPELGSLQECCVRQRPRTVRFPIALRLAMDFFRTTVSIANYCSKMRILYDTHRVVSSAWYPMKQSTAAGPLRSGSSNRASGAASLGRGDSAAMLTSFALRTREAPATQAAASAAGADVPHTLTYYDVGRFFSFNCTLPRTADSGNYVWRKNGTLVEELWDLRDRYKVEESLFRMTVRTNEDDFGNYSCALGGNAPALAWELRGRPHAKLPPNTNVVEGQKLKLVCKVVGKPYPDVKWLVSNSSDEGNLTDVTAALGARAQLSRSEQGVDNGELVLESAVRADAGVYTCAPNEGLSAPTVLRVKDMYAALWPFLGICAEVFVLCAIILVYEKRRTKPELEDSDTDNHEQKKS